MSSSERSSPRRMKSSYLSPSTLPEYIPSPDWNPDWRRPESGELEQQREEEVEDDIPWDKPPDYPDRADEADEDTDDTDTNFIRLNNHTAGFSSRGSPRRSKRFLPPPPLTPTHKRRKSSQSHLLRPSRSLIHHKPKQASEKILLTPPDLVSDSVDPYLDSLLERSVHALEMSNTLLQSSISTQSSLSTILTGGDAEGSTGETRLEAQAMSLRSRIQDDWDARTAWADDLEEIKRDVDGLFGGLDIATTTSVVPATPSTTTESESFSEGRDEVGIRPRSSSHRREGSTASGISCSLPTVSTLSSAPMTWNRRRPSLNSGVATTPGLHFARQSRENLISSPPRPVTQYTPSFEFSDEIVPTPTVGGRSHPSIYQTCHWKSVSELASSSTTSLLTVPSLSTPLLPPKLTDKPLEPSTPAYNMLSSFVRRPTSGSETPSASFTTSFMAGIRRTNSRRSSSASSSPHLRDHTPRLPHRDIISHRLMTPPVEESSSSESCMAKRTVQSLRKILDEQPPPVPRIAGLGLSGDGLKAPKFMPRTPAPLPEASTSNATASISRLFTKGTHSSSTRAPSPRQSAMKHSRNNSAPPTPNSTSNLALPVSSVPPPSPTTLNIPEIFSKVLNGVTSTSSSGRSTPNKHISFAELPESYASTRPGGAGSSKFKEKHNHRKKRKGSSSAGVENGTGSGGLGFSTARWWLGGAANTGSEGLSTSLAKHEERIEDRLTRSWGGRMSAGLFSSGLDDEWLV